MKINEYKTLICQIEGSVLTVILNRPERLNAFNAQMFSEVEAVSENSVRDPDVRVVVFTGMGRAFSSGADLSDIAEGRSEFSDTLFENMIQRAQRVFDIVESLPKPTIAAINGHAVGAGLQLALACDFRIAARGVKLGLSDVKRGIIPALGATTRLPRLIGLARSKELILSGDLILSEAAHAIGLVNEVVDSGTLAVVVRELAEKLIANAPLALAAAKELLNADAPLDEVSAAQSKLFQTADAVEGITSFLEKRVPRFRGL